MTDNFDGPNGTQMAAVPPMLSERVKQLQLHGRLDGDRKGGGNSWLPWMLCVMMALAWAGVGIRFYRTTPASGSPVSANPGSSTTPGNGAAAATKKEIKKEPQRNPDEPVLDAKGYITPAHQISISPIEVSGRVTVLNIEEGKAFKKDEILAEIEDVGFRADYEEAKANLSLSREKCREMVNGNRPEEIEQARAELGEAEANLKQYRLEWERYQGKSVNAIAIKDFDTVESNYRGGEQKVIKLRKSLKLMVDGNREERIKQAQADVEANEARLKRAEWKLQNCKIRSPVDGIILSKKAEIGSLINPVVGGISTSLCDMADLSDLEVDMEIQERDIAKVFDGQLCRIKADAYPDRVYEGYVDRAMPIGNRARGIIPIRVKVVIPPSERQGEFLKPEMGVTVTFFAKKFENLPKTHTGKTLPKPLLSTEVAPEKKAEPATDKKPEAPTTPAVPAPKKEG